jgi:hypothetical protein
LKTLTKAFNLSLIASYICLAAPDPKAAGAISFAADVAPLLQRRCVTCHGPEKAKGHYRLDTFEALMKPVSDQKPTVVPGRPDVSRIVQLIVEKNIDDRMPQNAEPLPAAEIAIIRNWIAAGADFDGPSPTAALVSFLPKPAHPAAPARYAHPWPVTALAFSADGVQLAASGYHEITFWNPANGGLLRRLGGMPERIRALAWQPGGNRLAVAGGAPGRSGEILLVDLSSNIPPLELTVTGDEMLCLAFSGDGQHLAAGGADKTLRVFAVTSGTEILRLDQHSDWVQAVAFSPDGHWLASASRDRTARIYNAATGESGQIFRGHEGPVESLIFDPDGNKILSAGADRVVRSWETADAEHTKDFAKFDLAVTGLAAGDESVFIALADGRVVQRNRSDGAKKHEFGGSQRLSALAFHAPSHRLVTGSLEGRVQVWSVQDGRLLADFTASPGVSSPGGRPR